MSIVQHRPPARVPVIRHDAVHRVVVALALGALFALALGALQHRSPALGAAVFVGVLGIAGVLADDRAVRVALARHRPGEHRPGVPLSPDRTARPARHHQEDPVAIGFSLSQQRLDPETRRKSKNPRAGRERRASTEAFELHAERRGGVLPWAAPARQRIPVSGKDRRTVTRRLERDGWTVHTRKARRGWFW